MDFPGIAEYMKIVHRLKVLDESLPRGLRLTTGNCGMFALALHKYYGVGELVLIDDHTPYGNEGYAHVMLFHNGMYYDGKGVWTRDEVEEKWFDTSRYGIHLIEEHDEIERQLQDNTSWTMDSEQFIQILREIS